MANRVAQDTLKTELHSRKVQNPEDVRRRQRDDAEKELAARQATLPTVVTPPDAPETTAALIVPSQLATPAELAKTLAEQGPSFLPIITFDNSEPGFKLRSADTYLDPDARYICHAPGTWFGYIKFGDVGEAPQRLGGQVCTAGFKLPPLESLPDRDAASWPISNLTKQREDPWKLEYEVPLQAASGELYAFSTMSKTGRSAVKSFLETYNRLRFSHPDALPIVQLRPSFYIDKKRGFGRVNVPTIVMVGRAQPDGTQTTITPLKPLTPAEDMNDEIGF
jgi:hypothetical protein